MLHPVAKAKGHCRSVVPNLIYRLAGGGYFVRNLDLQMKLRLPACHLHGLVPNRPHYGGARSMALGLGTPLQTTP